MPVDKSPLHLAVEAGAADIVKLLLAAGAAAALRCAMQRFQLSSHAVHLTCMVPAS